jgi:hypothetical protein
MLRLGGFGEDSSAQYGPEKRSLRLINLAVNQSLVGAVLGVVATCSDPDQTTMTSYWRVELLDRSWRPAESSVWRHDAEDRGCTLRREFAELCRSVVATVA